MIAAGGTGGHIFPGLALAEALRRRAPQIRVSFIGTPRGLERSIIPKRGYPLHLIDMHPFVRRVGVRPLIAALSLIRSTGQARRVLRSERAGVVVGMGGYVSLPVIAAARWLRLPALLHESGAVPGLANRIAARLTPHVAVAFPQAARGFPRSSRPKTVGMPLDASLAGLARHDLRQEALSSFDLPGASRVLLILGGSLGAKRLNDVGVALAVRWRNRDDIRILWKTGRDHLETVRAELDRRDAERVVRCVGFIDRMDLAYAAADVAVCRAGAGTVAELAAAGLPSILVPYPHATGDHQMLNAQPLIEAGAAVVLPDAEADAETIGGVAEVLLRDEQRLARMGAAAIGLARPRAADELAAWALELSNRHTV
jgi:UDP-N-acetylglucosamine--N-acetylmuramyl-(pentapeptide) pyrophosphoryl-undecaprenol N-acetylglucosamine transferase